MFYSVLCCFFFFMTFMNPIVGLQTNQTKNKKKENRGKTAEFVWNQTTWQDTVIIRNRVSMLLLYKFQNSGSKTNHQNSQMNLNKSHNICSSSIISNKCTKIVVGVNKLKRTKTNQQRSELKEKNITQSLHKSQTSNCTFYKIILSH